MDIREFIGRLDHVKGPNASGNYVARCPAHDDKQASLTFCQKPGNDGKEKIFFKCQAGCDFDRVIQALGMTARDLVVDPDPPANPSGRKQYKPRSQAKPQTSEMPQVHQAVPLPPPDREEDKPKIDWSHPTRVYPYTDENGKVLFEVCRFEYMHNGRREKTFRQRRYDPTSEKANKAGYVWSVPDEVRDSALYKLPELMAAIRAGRPVYVVEGEKDVETMERLGHVATCNVGGAGKWHHGHTSRFRGADVIILPDNDTKGNAYAGQEHAWNVAMELRMVAKRVRLVDLLAACPTLPPKGDISDLIQIMGDTDGKDALARQVAATRSFGPDTVQYWLSPFEQCEKLYAQIPGYSAKDGCIVQQMGENSTKALTDFVVIPRMELTRDDGVNHSLYFVLDGWNSYQQPLKQVTVPSGDLGGMKWIDKEWGFMANLSPGTATAGKVAWVIKKVGQKSAQRVTEYNHTGWRKIDGKWCYLYQGGAVGLDGVTVEMGAALSTYRLDGGGAPGFEQTSYKDACGRSLSIQNIMKESIGLTLLGTVYLAPLREFLYQMDIVPAFALFLYGPTGNHKTTAAALAMSHFGNFHAKNPPTSFNDTANNIRMKAFLVKDMPLLVDDFHPAKSAQEKRSMSATAQTLSRAFGDGVDRGRLNADSTIKAATPPRSVAIITGEDLPEIGASGLARFFILDIDKGDIPLNDDLTALQDDARNGVLQKAMRGYISWIAQQADTLPERLKTLFLKYRDMVRKQCTGVHDRAPEAVACILLGYAMMLDYFRAVNQIDTDTAGAMLEHAFTVLTDVSRKQAEATENEKPTRIFLDGLAELLASKTAALKDISPNIPPDEVKDPSLVQDMLGYMDNDYYYFLPAKAYGAVSRLCREQGVEFPVSFKALCKELKTDGIITAATMDKESATKVKKIDGRPVRLLWVPRTAMDGPKLINEQMKMEFTPVTPADNPFA